jgi:hypothetical protein
LSKFTQCENFIATDLVRVPPIKARAGQAVSTRSDPIALNRIASRKDGAGRIYNPEPVSGFAAVAGWVLLADPGAGKTDVFKTLSEAEGGHYIAVRDFLDLALPTGWQPPLFIDGLDEVTAGTASGQTVLGQIRSKLHQMGTPQFRLSCREADWRGSVDSQALAGLVGLVGEADFHELHLEPLVRSQTAELTAHWQHSDIDNAEQFIRDAEDRDLEGLLNNPQTLRMLVKATATGWPDSKAQTYEMACAQLVREQNDEHRAAQHNSPLSEATLLAAAGHVCAVMLLSASASIALKRLAQPAQGVVELTQMGSIDLSPYQAVLRTPLFKGEGNFCPVHRTVGEYLGATYISARINAGLPASRILALMQGDDGGVLPELRGLQAWLAAVGTSDLRRQLIDSDPLGLVLYGDVRNFSREEKLQVLGALHREAEQYPYFRSQNWASSPFGALATTDMQDDFRARLQSPDRGEPHLALVDCLLDALEHGEAMPDLATDLEKIARDKTYRPSSRTTALGVLASFAQKSDDWSVLLRLLADVHTQAVEDLQDELLGTLLSHLHPGQVPHQEVWRYFRTPKATNLIGAYRYFWNRLVSKTPLAELPTLLDALQASGFKFDDALDGWMISQTVEQLLNLGVTQYGTEIDPARLNSWLSIGWNQTTDSFLRDGAGETIRQWLGEHPKVYKAIFEHRLTDKSMTAENASKRLLHARAGLHHANQPQDRVDWFQSLARRPGVSDELRRELLSDVFHWVHMSAGADVAQALVEKWTADNANDAAWANALHLQTVSHQRTLSKANAARQKQRKQQVDERAIQRTAVFSKILPNFPNGQADLGALVEVADAYLNFSRRASEDTTPKTRLLELLDHNPQWVEWALAGLRRCVLRDDLPSANEIIDLFVQKRRYNLATPCLAAMALRSADDPNSILDLPKTTLETVSAFALTSPSGASPQWVAALVRQQASTAARVMQQLIGQQITAQQESVFGLSALAHDAEYEEIAQLITPTLIEQFPAKASQKQLQSLRLLIVTLLARLEPDVQREMLAKRLASTKLDVAQRVYWLTAAVQIAPEVYLESARQFIAHTQARTSHAADLVEAQRRENREMELSLAARLFFIGLFGVTCTPKWGDEDGTGFVTSQMEMGRYVQGLILALAGDASDEALIGLEDLHIRPDLKHWKETLTRALYEQRVTRRKARFKPESVSQVCATLANGKPANAADLWALTVDHLTRLTDEIRNGNTNDYGQYWAGDTPELEDACRNALLSDLKKLLELHGVAAEPEGRYADAKRADIKVIAPPYQLPIEIKRQMHGDLWTAIERQLVAKYGRESSSDGYGIYLVFWFGSDFPLTAQGKATKPRTPQALKQLLRAAVADDLRHKIAVLVVDCSKPATP